MVLRGPYNGSLLVQFLREVAYCSDLDELPTLYEDSMIRIHCQGTTNSVSFLTSVLSSTRKMTNLISRPLAHLSILCLRQTLDNFINKGFI